MKTYTHKRRSPIWQIAKPELQRLCDESDSFTQILVKLGYCHKGNNHSTLLKKIQEDGVSLDKLNANRHLVYSRKGKPKLIPLEDVLVENSTYSRSSLKKRLIQSNILENKCSECGSPPVWNGKELKLQLEHKNGVPNDNRLDNLCLLCPNCHSQTDTFAGKSNKKLPKPKKVYDKHQPNFKLRRVERPSKDELSKMVWEKPTVQIAKDYGVSDKAVAKWVKAYGLEKPHRGYWGFSKLFVN